MLLPMRRLAFALTFAVLALVPAQAQAKFFQSPSGNIGCVITSTGVRCDIAQKSWKPPPKPRSCSVDWGDGLTVGRRGKAKFTCAGDTVLRMGRKLAYGKTISAGRFRVQEPEKWDAMRESPQPPRFRPLPPARESILSTP